MTLRIEELRDSVLVEVPYATPRIGGGVAECLLQVSTGRAVGLPAGLDAMLITADL